MGSSKTEQIQENDKKKNSEESPKCNSENIGQEFLVKTGFIPTKMKKTDNYSSTRPQTSSSRSYKSLNYSNSSKIEAFSQSKIISRPSSSLLAIQDKIIEEVMKSGYLVNEEKQMETAKTEGNQNNYCIQKKKIFFFNEIHKESSNAFQNYPQFFNKVQKSILKDLKNY